MGFFEKNNAWLLPTVIVLFVLEVILFPVVVSMTYAGNSESPEHIITYRTKSLTWDNDTEVRDDGSGILTLFDTDYQNVKSQNTDRLVAPGTEGDNIVRLKNECGNTVSYTATMYKVTSNDELPVKADMQSEAEETEDHVLPENIEKENAVKSYKGSLKNGQIADFTIDWLWNFYDDDDQDKADTQFGDNAAEGNPENVLMGIYIVIDDEGKRVYPSPKTGNNSMLYIYVVLFVVSGTVLILTVLGRHDREESEEND